MSRRNGCHLRHILLSGSRRTWSRRRPGLSQLHVSILHFTLIVLASGQTHNFGFCPQVANGLQLTKDCPFTHFSKSLVSEYIGCLGISLDIVIGVLYHLMAVERGGSVDGNYIVIVRNKTITNIHSLVWVMVSRMPCRYVMICTLMCVLLCIDL